MNHRYDDRDHNREPVPMDELELRPPPNPPRPHALWVLGGFGMMLVGAILVASIALAAVGVVMGLMGLGMVVAAFVSEDGRGVRCQHLEEVEEEDDGPVRLDQLAKPKRLGLEESDNSVDEGLGEVKKALRALVTR